MTSLPATQSRDEAPPHPVGPQPLPMATIEWLWSTLGVRYGHNLTAKYEGFEIPVVKEDWRYELASLTDEQLEHGLKNLPPRFPPDAGEFRRLCEAFTIPRDPTPLPRLPAPRGRMELRPEIRAAVAALLEPTPAGEVPERVKVARRFVAMWDGKQHLSLRQQADLQHFKRVIERWGNAQPDAIAAAKAATQQVVDQRMQQEQGHAPAEH